MNFIEHIKALASAGASFYKLNESKIHIFTGLGCMTAGTILVGVGATKLGAAKNAFLADIQDVHKLMPADGEDRSDYQRRLFGTYFKSGARYVAVMIPGVGLFVVGVAEVLKGVGLYDTKVRNFKEAAIASEAAFAAYRERVIENEGADTDARYASETYITTDVDIVEKDEVGTPITNKNGEVKTNIKSTTTYYEPDVIIFDKDHPLWTGSREHDIARLKLLQDELTSKLCTPRVLKKGRYCGYLMENEMRELLGADPTAGGCVRGIFYDPRDNEAPSIDFDVFGPGEAESIRLEAFATGQIDAIPIKLKVLKTHTNDEGVLCYRTEPIGVIAELF